MTTRLRRHLAHAVHPGSLGPVVRRARSAWDARAAVAARELAAAWWASARRAATSVGGGAREALLMLMAYALYTLVRGMWGGTLEEGRESAAGLVSAERALGIDVEAGLQGFFVRHHLGMPFWNVLYVASQVVVLPLTVYLVYRYRRHAYAFVRNLVLISWSAGLVWYALQPVAPPRLLEGGLVDTVTAQTPLDLDAGLVELFYNPVAAMPSLHVGLAPVVAWALVRLTPWVWSRAIGFAYPALITVCVVVTGNHFVLDVAGGLAVVLPAALIAWLLTRPSRTPALPAPAPRPAGPARLS
jgi:membrane-associated phospholipid phosphatase